MQRLKNKVNKSKNKKSHWLPLIAVALGISLIIMDATVINVALPVIINDLHLSVTQAEWTNAIYSLMFAALLIVSGKLGDMFGRRKMFLNGMIIFVIASIAAGLSTSGSWLIIARFFQGIGAAMIMPATLATLNAIYHDKERAIAFAVWGSTIGGMAALGPLLGSWLTTNYSWHWAFWINIPVGLFIIWLTIKHLPETRDESTSRKLDYLAVLLSTIGLGAIVFSLIESQSYGWWLQDSGAISPVPIAFTVGIVLISIFTKYQMKRAHNNKPVLVDLRLLNVKSFRYGSMAALIVALGEFGLLFTLPLLLQNALSYTALATGWLIVSLAMGTFLVSGMTPRLTRKYGGRTVVQFGLALEVVAISGLALTLTSSISGWLIAMWLFIYGVGVGMATAQLTSVILADIPVVQSGQASGLQSTFRQLGSALGVAILGAILIGYLGSTMKTNLAEASSVPIEVQKQSVELVTDTVGVTIPSLQANPATADIGNAAQEAMIEASKLTFSFAAVIVALGFAFTWVLPKPSINSKE